MNEPRGPDPLEQRSRELFEDSVNRLDARTQSRLNQARQAALTELNKGAKRRYWLAAPFGGLAAAALVGIMLWNGGGQPTVSSQEASSVPLDDFDILSEGDELDILEDVEFYSWMADASGADAGH